MRRSADRNCHDPADGVTSERSEEVPVLNGPLSDPESSGDRRRSMAD
jgi:hypothetical protein